ncbi:trypsin-like serine protease [Vibrio sp. 10N.261.55.A7]|uniref:S1 family peptidase n=1 Tax=Vibrio sp. 10N.261.55.A7 TaxID=1880851 RepID=UPI000C832CFD|nr:trypsin-like serine protease [Vibrio sp. 10N.261.55.A7]PMJ91614.1 hypothetical protein BCU12_09475 [Vibrio sp. 10N.261.55.A7]
MNKNRIFLSGLLLGCASISFNTTATDVTSYIVNGSNASVTEFPSIATLFYDRINYDGVYGVGSFCGGTLLNEQYVLTAAHCLFDDGKFDESKALFISVVPQLEDESDFPNGNIQRIMAEEFYYHPSYNNSSLVNDIAIIKLASPYNINAASDAIQRPADETYRNAANTFKALGHGRTTDSSNPVGPLLETTLTYETNAVCDSFFAADIQNSHLCFSGTYNATSGLNNSTCNGDSGGPVYWERGANDWVQVGVTSFGPTSCGTGTITSVFTEIYDFGTNGDGWIDNVLASNVAANYIATDAKRSSALSPSTSGSSGSSSSGGALGWFTLFIMSLLLGSRQKILRNS